MHCNRMPREVEGGVAVHGGVQEMCCNTALRDMVSGCGCGCWT